MTDLPTPITKPGKGGDYIWHPTKGVEPLGPFDYSDASAIGMFMKYNGTPSVEDWRLLRMIFHSGRKRGRKEAIDGYAD